MNWQPTITAKNLQKRAEILNKIRQFFAERNILEVETPLLCKTTTTDPYINSFHFEKHNRYLQTSPEFPMKRLLAAGSGSIYQISKVFRDEEKGRYHNPEFTMLEWYRIHSDHHALMEEMNDFLIYILQTQPAEKKSYQDIFLHYLNINPHITTAEDLLKIAAKNNLDFSNLTNLTQDDLLHLLMTHCIEPHIGFTQPLFIYDFPISQAALAKIRNSNPPVAERFEVYVQGIELANGYHELGDPIEQKNRFLQDIDKRKKENYPEIPLDECLLSALNHGFPDCAGVALGIDRLIMIAAEEKSIDKVISFTWDLC